MQITKEDLVNLSNLSRITIVPGSEEKMLADMQAILGYISEINDVKGEIKDRVITSRESGHYNITREDVITNEPGSNTATILEETPGTEDGYVKVAQVFK